MKNLYCLILAMIILNGCAQSQMVTKNTTSSTDIFKEVAADSNIPQGYSDLMISSNLKTNKPCKYPLDNLFGNKKGTSDYMLLINIDSQITNIECTLKEENTKGDSIQSCESGDGIRYNFKKDLLIKAGIHHLIISIPEDGITIEKEISLPGGTRNLMQLVPQYRGRVAIGKTVPPVCSTWSANFTRGLKGLTVVLNGKEL